MYIAYCEGILDNFNHINDVWVRIKATKALHLAKVVNLLSTAKTRVSVLVTPSVQKRRKVKRREAKDKKSRHRPREFALHPLDGTRCSIHFAMSLDNL